MKRFCAILCGFLAYSAAASAADWPTRPIKFLIPWGAGGVTDALSRMYGEYVSKELGQPVVFDYKPGAAGRIGLAEIARAAPDGYFIGMANSGPMTIHPNLYAKLAYDPDSFALIGMMAVSPLALAVSAKSPIHSVRELIEASQTKPLNFGTYGIAGPQHLAMEMMKKIGVKGVAVHYRGAGADIMAAIVNGALDATFDTVYQQKIYQDGDQYRILAVTSAQRMPQLPDVPTFAELGYPDMRIETFYAAVAPGGLSAPIRDKLVKAYGNAAHSHTIREYLQTMSLTNVELDPAKLRDYVKDWRQRWKTVIDEQAIKVE